MKAYSRGPSRGIRSSRNKTKVLAVEGGKRVRAGEITSYRVVLAGAFGSAGQFERQAGQAARGLSFSRLCLQAIKASWC